MGLFGDSTLAQVGYRARRIEPEMMCDVVTKVDMERAACQCTTFLDRCAAEAAAFHWFTPGVPRSQVMTRILDALAEHGPLTARQLEPIIGFRSSATEKAMRRLVDTCQVEIAGQAPTMGKPRIYRLPEVER